MGASFTEADGVWRQASQQLKQHLSGGNFAAWLGQAKAVAIDDDTFVLSVPSTFAKDRIEGQYLSLLSESVSRAAERQLEIALVSDEGTDVTQTEEAAASPPHAENSNGSRARESEDSSVFSPKYTFDSFVIGSSNRFAHAAALAVAEAPAGTYNPLFIYGGVGLGKTHLLHAIGHYVQMCYPELLVRYVSSEQFMNEFILALRRSSIPQFHARYRAADLLLIDDIQFLEGKERTQEEFFHTFNALHPKSQIVMTSDRSPKKLATLEERLTSRFASGLMTDIQPPDLETRLAILQKKAETDGLHLPLDVMSFIANRIQTNIRELEGALIRVAAYASLTRCEPTLKLAQTELHSLFPESEEAHVTPELVIAVTAEYFDVTPDEVRSPNRSRPLVAARQIAMYLCRELTDYSLPRIGAYFGGRDHSTVIHAAKKVRAEMQQHPSSFEQVRELTTRIRQRASRR